MKTRMAVTGLLAGVAIAALAMTALTATADNEGPGLVGAKVDNFMLIDQQGIGHQLHYYKSNPAVVIVTTQTGDAASAKAVASVVTITTAGFVL